MQNDGTLYQEPEPRLFSFNNPYGACPRCQGFGNTIDFDLNLVVPDRASLSMRAPSSRGPSPGIARFFRKAFSLVVVLNA